jgi:restriction system protein
VQHTFAFTPPRWRPPTQLPKQTGVFLLGSLVWLGLYGWLGYRLWVYGFRQDRTLNLLLTSLCILLGVLLALVWQRLGDRWWQLIRAYLAGGRWRALSVPQLQRLTPAEFEAYIARLFVRQGYHVTNVRETKDGGVDILLTDERGRQAVVQCKRYRQNVGEPALRDLYGTMVHAGATHAFLITTAGFSDEARLWARGKPITLIDGSRLVQLARTEPEQAPLQRK